ncbi:MAG TPA: hypothetical protein VL501_05105 [Pyrinomonadaceae bacterium]|nr:hypothetical protein [Pyrinomonadaceae bacterium]
MKLRAIAVATLVCLFANFAAFAAQPNNRGKRGKTRKAVPVRVSRLMPLLPASDGVVLFDSKKFLTDGLPRVLAAKQDVLAKITESLNDVQSKTGIDLRQFEEVAVGVNLRKNAAGKLDVQPVAIASGDINAAALLAVAKLASNGTYKEETIAGRTVYVFAVKDAANKASTQVVTGKVAGAVDKIVNGITTHVAVAAYDKNSLVLGSLERVRETLEGRTHPGVDITSLLMRSPAATVNFALKTPTGLDTFFKLGNDEFGRNLRSIQYVAGSMDVNAAGASLNVAAKTLERAQADQLKSTLDGLQMLGGAMFGNAKSADKQVYGRMIKNAKITQTGSEVTLDVQVPQADIDTLVSGIK